MMHELSGEELRQGSLPVHISQDQTAAIPGIEMFDREYIDRICDPGLPTIFVDGCRSDVTSMMNHDRISMESLSSTISLVDHVISKGARTIGFVGDPDHCNSFHERR